MNLRYSFPIGAVVCFLLAAAILHLIFMIPIGFMSDDYALLASAKKGERLWYLHYSFFLEFLWKHTASGQITALHWRLGVLLIHFFNVFLLYLITHKRFKMSTLQSFFICACFMMSPAGVEALAWTCSAGYVLTTFWILLAWYYFLGQVNEKPTLLASIYLALLQIAAFLTWDWGGLLFPILCVFAFWVGSLRNVKLLSPILICWSMGVILRAISHYGLVWQHNEGIKKLQFLGGASFLGLFPNLSKEIYQSWCGIFLVGAFAVFLGWTAYRNRLGLAMLICFLGSILPWVNGGNPSSRYFYLSMPFVYVVLAIGLAEIQKKSLIGILGLIVLTLELSFTYQRDKLWKMAFQESQQLKEAVKKVITKSSDPLVIINLPEAYGPEQMPMRPQMWYSGFSETFPGVSLARTKDCPYIWQKSMHLKMNRADVCLTFPNTSLYEVIYKQKDDWHQFLLIPFMNM